MKKLLSFLLICSISLCSQPDLTIIGNVDMIDGMGKQSAELIQAFKDELSISFVHTRKPNLVETPDGTNSIFLKKSSQYGKVVLLEEVVWDPLVPYYKFVTKADRDQSIIIAYSMFESDRILPEWVDALNTHFDAVAVPDAYLVNVYRNSGVTTPIFELPLGIHIDHLLEQPLKTKKHKPFVFGYFSYLQDRKNQLKLAKAFAKAFKNNPYVHLQIHARGAEPTLKKELFKIMDQTKNIYFHQGRLNREKYLKLFQSIDCYVSTSKGEGFSIQPREAMALGIPVTATNNTAQSTICNSGLIRPIPATIKTPAYYSWAKKTCGHFFDCSEHDIIEALRDVYINYTQYLTKSQQAREWAQKYSYHTLKPLYRSLIKPNQIFFGEENKLTDEYLMTNSIDLYYKYLKIIKGE